jgi:hypothetical protein
MEKVKHFEISERLETALGSVKVVSMTACGKMIHSASEISWTPSEVTCKACLTNMPPDFRQYV